LCRLGSRDLARNMPRPRLAGLTAPRLYIERAVGYRPAAPQTFPKARTPPVRLCLRLLRCSFFSKPSKIAALLTELGLSEAKLAQRNGTAIENVLLEFRGLPRGRQHFESSSMNFCRTERFALKTNTDRARRSRRTIQVGGVEYGPREVDNFAREFGIED
jgi:hypothetical protein